MLLKSWIETPIGPMVLLSDRAEGLLLSEFARDPERPSASAARFGLGPVEEGETPGGIAAAFDAYFGGDLQALDALVLPPLGTPFQRAVWAELRRIPPGETRSYADIARALGGAASGPGPNARAVGTANGANPRAIVVPCHRVIGADGSLTGYAGGLETKAWLLRHEGWRGLQPTLF
jgi:methylated-DNA-[protein]-cysteine S-methyltransferase